MFLQEMAGKNPAPFNISRRFFVAKASIGRCHAFTHLSPLNHRSIAR
jgi:hypothetical protein